MHITHLLRDEITRKDYEKIVRELTRPTHSSRHIYIHIHIFPSDVSYISPVPNAEERHANTHTHTHEKGEIRDEVNGAEIAYSCAHIHTRARVCV